MKGEFWKMSNKLWVLITGSSKIAYFYFSLSTFGLIHLFLKEDEGC
jgi:hypothetical protein